jgi:hypothetical protein
VISDETKDAAGRFGKVVEGAMRPLVRAMIAHGLTAPAFYRMLKRLYVNVAEREFRLQDQEPTDSRISLLTGVHRRDVRSLRNADARRSDPAREKATVFASVVGRWLAGPGTVDSAGVPLPLPRSGDAEPNFERLVRAVSTDIRPKTVLDELERQGLVQVIDGVVTLTDDAVVGPKDLAQKAFYFRENIGDHMAAAVDNLMAEEPRFLERAVFYNRLSPESVAEIEAEARRLGNEALIALNRLAQARQRADAESADNTSRFRFGVYFYETEEEQGSNSKDEGGNV